MRPVVLHALTRLAPVVLGTAGKQRLSILIYHRVLPQADPMRPDEPTVADFDWQMRLLRAHFNPLPLREAQQRLQEGTLPARAVCVTFDDGYSDNEACALPVLSRYRVPATVFVSTAFLNGGRMFNDTVIEAVRNSREESLDLRDIGLDVYPLSNQPERLSAVARILGAVKHMAPTERARMVAAIERRGGRLPDDLMLTDAQLRRLADSGVEIGAHTANHPILASIGLQEARREIVTGRERLQECLQQPVDSFAYPNGKPGPDYGEEHRDLVRELGFKRAVSTQWGAATPDSDSYQLPRFTPWDKSAARFTARLLLNYRRLDPLLSEP